MSATAVKKRSATTAQKKRVIELCEAISNLHPGDLYTVLELDELELVDEAARVGSDVDYGRVGTGVEYGRLLEQHLTQVMVAGECSNLKTTQKPKRQARSQLGGRVFDYDRVTIRVPAR
jgi:hypothetical protein